MALVANLLALWFYMFSHALPLPYVIHTLLHLYSTYCASTFCGYACLIGSQALFIGSCRPQFHRSLHTRGSDTTKSNGHSRKRPWARATNARRSRGGIRRGGPQNRNVEPKTLVTAMPARSARVTTTLAREHGRRDSEETQRKGRHQQKANA